MHGIIGGFLSSIAECLSRYVCPLITDWTSLQSSKKGEQLLCISAPAAAGVLALRTGAGGSGGGGGGGGGGDDGNGGGGGGAGGAVEGMRRSMLGHIRATCPDASGEPAERSEGAWCAGSADFVIV